MLLPYYLAIISYRFSSKYTRVAYVVAILVPIAIPGYIVNVIELEGVII